MKLRSFLVLLILLAVVGGWMSITAPIPPKDIRDAASKSLSILQVSGHKFIARSQLHCVACHHHLLTALVEDQFRQKEIPFTDTFRAERIRTTLKGLRVAANMNHPADFLNVKFAPAYALLALHADGYAPDNTTEISVDYLLHQQQSDGSFAAEYGRPPQEGGEAHLAALCIRDIRLYAAPAKAALVEREVAATRHWFTTYHSEVQQEVAFQLLGLAWCDASVDEKKPVADRLLQLQGPDGSWSQLATMRGDAYATGQALYALAESKMLKPTDEAYQKGIAWLLKNQESDGSWFVYTRAYPIQPRFNSDFPPYDENQYISAAATNWATLALLDALPVPGGQVAGNMR